MLKINGLKFQRGCLDERHTAPHPPLCQRIGRTDWLWQSSPHHHTPPNRQP